MSVLLTSPQDNRLFSAEIAAALEDINAAVIVQQLHYWMGKEGVGTIIGGVKYVYNTFNDWVTQFPWLSVWQFRKAMKLLRDLEIVKVIRYKAKCWNQTNYYSLDCDQLRWHCRDRLKEYLNPRSARSTETVEMRDTTDREVESQQIEVRNSKLSYNESKKTNQKRTAQSRETSVERSRSSNQTAAALSPIKNALEEEVKPKEGKTSFTGLKSLQAQNKTQSEPCQKVVGEESKQGKCSINVTKIVNPQWKSLIDDLDSLGVPINKTLVSLVKMYSEEEVKKAISLLKIRKQEKHIPNLGGYFTAALKGNWASSNSEIEEDTGSDGIDKGSVFRLWYGLAKELGYCSSQEIREGVQWVCLSGQWEKWESAVKRGYSVEYLKGVMKRNRIN